MNNDIFLDLGEYGEVIVSSLPTNNSVGNSLSSERLIDASVSETVTSAKEYVRVQFNKILKLPMTGLGKLFLATLPDTAENDDFELDEFNIAFEFGLTTEGGIDAGAVLKIVPNGNFKCNYTWKRKASKNS